MPPSPRQDSWDTSCLRTPRDPGVSLWPSKRDGVWGWVLVCGPSGKCTALRWREGGLARPQATAPPPTPWPHLDHWASSAPSLRASSGGSGCIGGSRPRAQRVQVGRPPLQPTRGSAAQGHVSVPAVLPSGALLLGRVAPGRPPQREGGWGGAHTRSPPFAPPAAVRVHLPAAQGSGSREVQRREWGECGAPGGGGGWPAGRTRLWRAGPGGSWRQGSGVGQEPVNRGMVVVPVSQGCGLVQ